MSEIKYVHLRHQTRISENQFIPSCKGGATLAYEVEDREGIQTVVAAWARCNNKDNFCKKKGRSISSNRLKNRYRTIEFQSSGNRHDDIDMMVDIFYDSAYDTID